MIALLGRLKFSDFSTKEPNPWKRYEKRVRNNADPRLTEFDTKTSESYPTIDDDSSTDDELFYDDEVDSDEEIVEENVPRSKLETITRAACIVM